MLQVPDGVDRDVGCLHEIQRVLIRQRAARVAAVRVEHEHLLAVLRFRAVEVHPQRVVERRHPVDLAHADPLDEARVVVGVEARDAHLRREIDERHVRRPIGGVHELDGGLPRGVDVFGHAAARVEQKPEVQRWREVRLPFDEVFDGLLVAVLDDLEVIGLQAADRIALLVDDGDTEIDEVHAGAKRRLLRRRVVDGDEDEKRKAPDARHSLPQDLLLE